jgi:peptidoglycan/xylan/chitin deacetylase (PgdA/CDA1 family)
MLNYRNSSLIFLFLLAVLTGLHFFYTPISLLVFIGLFLLYSGLLFYGSATIQSNFHMPVVCTGKTKEKVISITFDDGPVAGYTDAVLDLLLEYKVKGAFFCVGSRIPGNEKLMKRLVEEGHAIGNHSFSHSFLFDFYSAKRLEGELEKAASQVFTATGKSMRFFRPPYGVTTPNLR